MKVLTNAENVLVSILWVDVDLFFFFFLFSLGFDFLLQGKKNNTFQSFYLSPR